MLPGDSHVHTEWSWDTATGSMERTCARALELGLPSVALTEHVDRVGWPVVAEIPAEREHFHPLLHDGVLTPPPFDAAGYLAAVERCRDRFPGLRILSGLELGEPHLHPAATSELLASGPFDRVLGSLHGLPRNGLLLESYELMHTRPAAEGLRMYLAEVLRLLDFGGFAVLAHLDYPLRHVTGPVDLTELEDEYRAVLRKLARSGRALEVNTKLPMPPVLLRWWREEGGEQVTFGSDAHTPDHLARGFAAAAAMVEAHGFRPGRHPYDVWFRHAP